MTGPAALPGFRGSDGVDYPAVGFGTYKLNGAPGMDVIREALHGGYRLLDTAVNYENEGAVGAAARTSRIPRDQLLIASKLPGRFQDAGKAVRCMEESLYRTGLDHLDLYLIHWPNPLEDHYVEAWQALIEARNRGLVRSIGVCNFLPEHLDRLAAETGVLPVLNQIEMHPYFPQQQQRAYHADHGILTQSWSPLGRGSDLLTNPVIMDVATRVEASPAQVVLRWHVDNGSMPIPKATAAHRQHENLDLADVVLDPADLAAITALGRPDGRLSDSDPATHQEF